MLEDVIGRFDSALAQTRLQAARNAEALERQAEALEAIRAVLELRLALSLRNSGLSKETLRTEVEWMREVLK